MTNIIKNILKTIFPPILFGLISTILIVGILLYSILLVPTIKIIAPMTSENISLMNISLTAVFVFVTSIYVYFTYQIVKQSTIEREISFIEKRLEKLYYPLNDILSSEYVFCLIDAEGYIESADLGLFSSDTKRYKVDEIVPFVYLATNELEGTLYEFIDVMRNSNPMESVGIEFNNRVELLKEMTTNDIDKFRDKLRKLIND